MGFRRSVTCDGYERLSGPNLPLIGRLTALLILFWLMLAGAGSAEIYPTHLPRLPGVSWENAF